MLVEGKNTGLEAPAKQAGSRLLRIPDIISKLINEDKLTAAERFLEKVGTISGCHEVELCYAAALIDIGKKKYDFAEKELCMCLRLNPHHGGARRKLIHLLYPYRKKCSAETAEVLISAGGADSRGRDSNTGLRREFLVYCCLGEYEKAFRLGERLLGGNILGASELTTPWEEYFTPSRKLYLTHYNILRRLDLPARLRIWQVYYLSRLAYELHYPAPLDPLEKKLYTAAPKYNWMYLIKGMRNMADSSCTEALKCLKKVISACPNDWKARCLMGETYISMGNSRKAFAEFGLAARAPGNARALWAIYTWEGEMHLLCGNYRQAYFKSDAALKLNYNPMQLGWKGAAALKLGRTKEALNCLNEVVRKKPEDLEARVWRAEAYMACRDLEKASEDLNYVIKADKRSLWAYLDRAILNYRTGDHAGMKKDFIRFESIAGNKNNAETVARTQTLECRALYKILLKRHEDARGNRRNEPHLLPLCSETGIGQLKT